MDFKGLLHLLTEDEVNRAWYGIEKTLSRLGLIDNKLSLDVGHLQIYKTQFAPDFLPWDALEDIDEEHPEQMQALHELRGMEISVNLRATFKRLLND